jgi:hypothetical protein
MAEGYLHALTVGHELGRIEFPPEWVVRPDAVQWLPSINGREEHQLGEYLVTNGLTHSERATAELQKFWTCMPDLRLVAHGEPMIDVAGFAVWIRLEGTAPDGSVLGIWEFDIVRADEDGAIFRYEAMFDPAEFAALIQLVAGLPANTSWEEYREHMR